MTSVEKRRSGRRSGGHRKHSDGGYSDTSSAGSFLDETDREVSNLTDRAFRSLCIGDEAVYNDSDLCASSPCIQRDRQLAFSHGGQERDREDSEREELKRAAHESFSLRMRQYGQDWIHGGMYGAEIQRDPQWEVYGERTQGRVSATFQHSFVETSQQEESLREEQLSFMSNGATEFSSQQRRSRSRVSSLIRAFNSEGQRDGAGIDGKLREWNDETSWDKSALMSIQRELSEFSYQQNFDGGHFPPAAPFSARDTNFYSSEVAAVAHMNSASSFMRSSHSKHSMSAQVNCNSNFFIHSEFSPFKVWRDHNRFPFQQGEVSGFMHYPEFPKWYETPMYKELSLEAQTQGPYRFEERGIRHPRNNMAPVIPPTPPHSTSTSTMLQRALAVEKRCESELAGHYPHRKRTQSLGANRLPSQRPSTASPTSEMSRRVQDTITSVKALQQKIKMMTEQNIPTTVNQQGLLYRNDHLIPVGNNATTVAPNVVSSNTSTTPFNMNQLLTPLVHAQQEADTSEVRQFAGSPQLVEHAPVRAESRGATPDVRMSSYKSRATSLLFNLKDNRKRVKSTYSPTKFKGLETNKQPLIQEPRDTVIDIPDFPDPDIQYGLVEESSRTNAAEPYVNQYHNPGLPVATLNPPPATVHTGQYSEYTSSDYHTAQMQGEMVHHSGFTDFIPENYASNQLANGQNLHEDLSSFTPYNQGMIDNVETLEGDAYRLNPSYAATETPRLNADNIQTGGYLISKANTEQRFNETVRREFANVDGYQQLKDNKDDYSNVSSQDRWRQTNNQDAKNRSLKAAISPWKQEITALMEKDQHAQAYQRAAGIREELNLPRDKYSGGNQQSINEQLKKIELRESLGVGTSSHKNTGLLNHNISNQVPQYAPFNNDTVENLALYGQAGEFKDKYALQKHYSQNKENEMKDDYLAQNYNTYTDQEYRNQHAFCSDEDKTMLTQETGQRKQYTPIPKGHEMQTLQTLGVQPQFEHNMHKNSSSNPDSASAPTVSNWVKERQLDEVKAEQAVAENIKAQHAQAELAKVQHWAQVEQPKAESARLILAGQTGSEKVKAEQTIAELSGHKRVNQTEAEHIKVATTIEDQTQQQSTVLQKVTEELRDITEEAGGEQVKAEQRQKDEHIKTELAKAEQARIKQTETEQARRERIKAQQLEEEQVRAEQVERERIEAEQIRTEKVKAEQAEAERRKAEQAKLAQIKEQQAKAEQEKTTVVEGDSIRVNEEQPATQKKKAKVEKVEERTTDLERTKVELAKAMLTKSESMLERSAKPAAKLTQQVKSEPDRVEQVKTELARAKAELAKIKEKMRGEQKQKVKSTVLTKEEGSKKDVPLGVNINRNDNLKDQDQATQMHLQREDSVVIKRQSTAEANIPHTDDYELLREKYGFTDASANRNNLSAAGNVLSIDTNKTVLSIDQVETVNNEKSKDKHSPTSRFATANAEYEEEASSFKSNEATESHYIYSESSKEFKLSGANYLPSNADKRENSETVNDKVKDDSAEKLEKCDPLKQTDTLQQRDSDLAKPLPLERKPKSSEHNVGPSKEPHFTPPRALTHKERAQTKQEILTSKIKAHAEKEISAIKEKGFALRDGFISKTSTKQLVGSQIINARQRPPSQEVSKKHESTMSSNITPKHHMEPPGTQMEPVKSVSPSSSAAVPVKSAATTSQLVDHSQKLVPKEPMKSDDNVTKSPRDVTKTGSYTMSTDEGLAENQKKENQSGTKSPMQSKDLAQKNKQGKQEASHGKYCGKQTEALKDHPAIDTDHLKKKKETSALVKAESSKPLMTEKDESKHEAIQEDSAPSLNIVFGQSKISEAEDSLQITGIMVTVRERKPAVDNSTQEQLNAKENDCSISELDKCHHSSDVAITKGNESPKEVNRVNADSTHPPVKDDQPTVGMNIQETSTQETRQDNMPENVAVKSNDLQQESSSINGRPQWETLREPLAEKGVPSTVTAKNKVLAETQPHAYKQDIIARETQDNTNKTAKETSTKSTRKDEVKSNAEDNNPQKKQTGHTNENFMGKVLNTETSHTYDSNGAEAETVIKPDIQPTVKEDMTKVINPPKSTNIDGKSAPPLEEKRLDPTPPKPPIKTSSSSHFPENENRNLKNNEVDENVHIDGIAIRVVPAVTGDNLKTAGKHQITAFPSEVLAVHEHKQVASSSCEEKVNHLNNKDSTKDLTPASSEKQKKDSLEDKLGGQCMSSSVRKQSDSGQDSINTTSGDSQAENGKLEELNKSRISVDESKTQPMEGDYFQVQGVAEINKEPHHSANVGDTSDAVSKERELPGLLPNKAAIKNESDNDGKNVLDQSKRKTAESSSASVKNENMKKKNGETADSLASKQTDGPTERQSNKNEKTEAGQAIHIRKNQTETHSSLSARERQSSRNSHPTRENTVQEKPEVKPKPKERVSTIPEISAIADYARLKVIVSEERENTIQEFPPNKKEGFFPLIQTRHSRRPVFAADPQDLSVKEKSLPNKTEVSSKVNKEPKPLVFPITEKEHQRTGMFKLGDKERQEKVFLDANKASDGLLDAGAEHAQHVKERNKTATTHLKNQESEEQVAATDAQRVRQVDQSLYQPNNRPLQATTTSSAVNRKPSASQHLKPLDNNSHLQPTLDQVYNIEERTTTVRKDEKIENASAKIGEEETEKLRQERLATRHEETKAKQQSRVKHLEEERAFRIEEEKRAEGIKIKHMIEESRASLAEEERRAAQREEERRAREREAIAIKIKERREKQRKAERRAEEDRKEKQTEEARAAIKEEEMKEERRMKETEEKRRSKLREEDKQIKENEERRKVKQREERAAQDERQRRAAEEEQQRRSMQAEQQRRAAQEEQQRRAAQEEQQKRAAQEEQQRRAAQEEQRRRAAEEEQQGRAAQEEQKRRSMQAEQQRRAAQEEKQRRTAEEEQQRRAAEEEQQRRAAQAEQQRRAVQEEQQRRAAEEEQQRRAAQAEQQKKAAKEEQQRRAAQEEQQRRAALIEEQRRAKQIREKMLADIEVEKKRKQAEQEKIAQEERIKQIQEQKKAEQQIEKERRERQKKEEWMRIQREEEERRAVEKDKTILKQREEKQAEVERIIPEESQEKKVPQEQMQAQRKDEIRAKKTEEEEKLAAYREKERVAQMEEQTRAAQKMEALQYYAITSTESERKPRERQLRSPLPSQQRNNPSGLETSEDPGSHTRPYRPHAPASPAPSLPRSNTSSPALGAKPLMFRVKDNTIRGSSLTKSVKPRFHKNFGEDFRVGSPMERGSERGEEEQEAMRRSAGTPVHPDTGLNRLTAVRESSQASSSQGYSAPLPHYRPFSRRSIALDEDDSRSVISNMSEDVESFATSAADLADIRGLYDYERPESACSFSSDVSRSFGKPPAVPPKSEKALRRAQRLTTRRIKKELSKAGADIPDGVEKPLQEVSSIPSSSTEVRSSNRHAVASPHFSPPVSLAHAPALGSSLSSSHTEHQSSHSSFHASPHATGPISLPVASPHATAPVSLPVASPHATAPASHLAAPKIVAHVPSSPTLHHTNNPAPVTQYHVESSYPQSYPLTQRKVLQDLGSGQYFVVDVPVQVKTKTFFDPETGKYVQLNVRESAQSTSRHQSQPQQAYLQPQLKPQMQVKPQQQPISQASPAGKPVMLYEGYHGYPQGYQPPAMNSAPHHRSSGPATLHQDQQPVGEGHSYGYPAPETGQNSEGHRYSPEKTPYMDTVNTNKTYNTNYNSHSPYESFPECDTNSQLAGSSVCENDNSAHSRYQPRDIITMSELEDFMEVSDW